MSGQGNGSRIVVGVDCGSTSAAVVALDGAGRIVAQAYAFHHGSAGSCVGELLDGLFPEWRKVRVSAVVRTASSPALVVPGGEAEAIDGRLAEIRAARHFHPGLRSLLVVGAEKFARVSFDEDGSYRRMRGNSACAAGTGAFLDQQAARLGLRGGSAELAELALRNDGERPAIASRCSVFAKTDLIHAQQEGWSREEICDGLCEGLARNIADTLFPGERPAAPIVIAGGVSRNAAVRRHLSVLAGSPVECDEFAHLYGAIGACLEYLARLGNDTERAGYSLAEIAAAPSPAREYANGSLPEPGAGYPDFSSLARRLFVARKNGPSNPVELDIYVDPRTLACEDRDTGAGDRVGVPALLGLDIGSTSTKAAILSRDGNVVAGFYTRTAGQPLEATQSIFEAVAAVESEYRVVFEVEIAATTGSGRKLVAAVIGADSAIDEITAHARAAVAIDPDVDTIIEIGGQDSKFTVLRQGIVVFSQMNAVCAAGTGSFLEEQGARLGVPLSDFADRAIGRQAPLTSDRCTVFMERDLNHLQSLGYSTDELLAASLFSVCDNYLGKVAQRGSIGKRVMFQGATARNRALVAAFECRLGRQIQVSKFCHLTGAIGAALQARDEGAKEAARGADGSREDLAGVEVQAGAASGASAAPTRFRGFGIHALDLESRSERCGLCNNNCRLRVINVGGEEVAYGFLCGRDYSTRHFVGEGEAKHNRLVDRRKAIEDAFAAVPREAGIRGFRMGIPSSLYLAEDATFWKTFWEILGFEAVIASDDADALRTGKRLSGAEFCAPMALLYGQVHGLLADCDRVFLPIYLEEKAERLDGTEARRYYCNYSGFAATVTRCAEGRDSQRILSPLLKGRRGDDSRCVDELFAAASSAATAAVSHAATSVVVAAPCAPGGPCIPGQPAPTREEVDAAYRACLEARDRARKAVRSLYHGIASSIAVVLVGRPYAILSEALGKSIPSMIAKRGVEVLYSDMLPDPASGGDLDLLLSAFHWRYAAEVLKAASVCAAQPGLYPVLVTSFKCSPDSFAIEWFKRILDKAGKPYLILQIDEHDSSVGYETRIEAGLRSFRNHARIKSHNVLFRAAGEGDEDGRLGIAPRLASGIRGKKVLVPCWDPLVSPLAAANLRGCGIDALVLDESRDSIRRAMGSNTGQCIPINIIARECVEFIERRSLDPAGCVLWIAAGMWPCNIPLYAEYGKSILEHMGGGMEKVEVYRGQITFFDLGLKAMLGAYHAFLAGGTLRRLVCRTRPYELEPGAADRLEARAMGILASELEGGRNMAQAYREAFMPFRELALSPRDRPKVAIFGDLYARDNDVLNQDLIRTIESSGGEVITTSYLDYVKAVIGAQFAHLSMDGKRGEWAVLKAEVAVLGAVEKALAIRSGPALDPPDPWGNPEWSERLGRFGIRPEQEGECFDNAIKIFRMLEANPDISLFVETNPAFCCPSIVTQAMGDDIERVTGVPVVSITYDGTGAPKNDVVIPFLALRG